MLVEASTTANAAPRKTRTPGQQKPPATPESTDSTPPLGTVVVIQGNSCAARMFRNIG